MEYVPTKRSKASPRDADNVAQAGGHVFVNDKAVREASPSASASPVPARDRSPPLCSQSASPQPDSFRERPQQRTKHAQHAQQVPVGSNGEEDDEEEDDDEGLRTQQLRALSEESDREPSPEQAFADLEPEKVWTGAFQQRSEGLPGQLKNIKLENFMCHENFSMDFGPHVTFINGTNGSGKSAVLQGLQFCLGMQAGKTGRGTTAKHLIRTGAHSARAAVTLWNTGDSDAYLPEIYGNQVTIERRITGSGVAAYRVFDSRGKKMSDKRSEMQAILDHFNLDVGNPVTVMTQEMCKDFLAAPGTGDTGAKMRYKLYMKATSLDRTEEAHLQARVNADETQQRLNVMTPMLTAAKGKLKEVVATLEHLRSCEGDRIMVESLARVLAWSQVLDDRRDAATAADKVAKLLGPAKEKGASQLAEASQAHLAYVAESAAELDAMRAFSLEVERLATEQQALQREHGSVRNVASRRETAVKKLEDGVADLHAQKQTLLDAAKEANDDSVAASQLEQQQQEDAIRVQQEECDLLEGRAQQARADVKLANKEMMDAIDAEADLRRGLEGLLQEVAQLRGQQRELARGGKSKASAFGGQATEDLVAAIQQSLARFHRPPIGPLGTVLALKDNRWAMAVDAQLGKGFKDFLVHDHHDLTLLKSMRQCVKMPWLTVQVINYDSAQHRMDPFRLPPPHLQSMLSVLTCTEAAATAPVTNFLIDIGKAEKTVLCDSVRELEAAANAPNVNQAYAPDGTKRYKKGYSTTQIPYHQPFYPNGRLGGDTTAHAAELERRMQNAQASLAHCEEDLRQAATAVAPAKQRKLSANGSVRDLTQAKAAVESQVDMLMSQRPAPLQPEAEGEDDGDSIRQRLAAVDAEIRAKGQALELASEAARGAQADLQDSTAAWTLKKEEAEAVRLENQRRTEAMIEGAQRAADLEAKVAAAGKFVAELERLLSVVWEPKQRDADARLLNSSALAQQLCSEQEADSALQALDSHLRTQGLSDEDIALQLMPQEIERRRKKLKHKLQASESQAGGTAEELTLRRGQLEQQVTVLRARLGSVVEAHNYSVAGIEQRRILLLLRGKAIMSAGQTAETVHNQFEQTLWRKKHRGRVKVRENDKCLDIFVQTDGMKVGNRHMVTDLKALSGGERSFVNVAFTLAVGEMAASPFRIMDEFDVFMDANNRLMTMSALFGFAYLKAETQLVLISPQDLAGVELSKKMLAEEAKDPIVIPEGFVKIVQVRPARGNAT